MVETKASRTRPTSPGRRRAGPRRQRLGARQQLAHLGQQRLAGRRERHAAPGAVEQHHAQRLLELGDGLGDRRLRHVQPQRGAAEVQFLGHGHELAPGPQVDQGFIHMPSISIVPLKIGLEAINQTSDTGHPPISPRTRDTMDTKPIQINRRSANIVEGKSRAPNRSMYYAMGYEEGDFKKPMVGVANGHSTITPCNSGLQKLADAAIAGIEEAGGNAQVFGTPTITDGMAMGTEGMKYSLVSREVISDCIETCVGGQWMDGVLVVGGCDKNMPGGMMGMLRANVPAIYVYGGTILPGRYKGQDLNIVSVFEAVGPERRRQHERRGPARDREARHPRHRLLRRHVHRQHHVSSAFEALGISLPYSSTMANPHDEKAELGQGVGQGADRGDQEGPEAARHRHQEGHRERGGGHHGHRRLDQRGAALPGHRARGRASTGPSTTSSACARRCRCSAT